MAKPAANLTRSAHKIIPKFHCRSVPATTKFYTEALHFELGGEHENMVSVFMGAKAEANIYLFATDEAEFRRSQVMVGLGRQELDDYYRLIVEEGRVKVTEELENKEWGFRQFEISDEDGNLIQFWTFIED